jgi:AFG3 family protein
VLNTRKTIVDEAYKRTLEYLRDHKEDVAKVAKLLLEKETITHDDVSDIVGPRPFKGKFQHEEFSSRRKETRRKEEQGGIESRDYS